MTMENIPVRYNAFTSANPDDAPLLLAHVLLLFPWVLLRATHYTFTTNTPMRIKQPGRGISIEPIHQAPLTTC